ncbi:MAG TPA: dipeptidase PepE [Burkholderiales bacterium]|nr:dipeptidase PepE [Burkholderiales bacterium]
MELLLLSSSRTPAGYLTDYLADIKDFTAGVRRALFVPFAAVSLPWNEYAKRVSEASGLALELALKAGDLAACDLIVVGGGNTFQLLRECRMRGFLEAIREKVKTGTRYLAWSAGANLACPTIRTTNDMPIVDPGGLEALALTGFQINPHYVNVALPGHHGETRDERLAEFARVNPKLPVIGLPEGAWLRVSDSTVELRGPYPAVLFSGENPARKLMPGTLPPNFGDKA